MVIMRAEGVRINSTSPLVPRTSGDGGISATGYSMGLKTRNGYHLGGGIKSSQPAETRGLTEPLEILRKLCFFRTFWQY